MSVIARYALRLTLRSPFVFQGLANSRLGVDATYLRDEKDRPVIPADQVKGVLRSACFTLIRNRPALALNGLFKKLFGDASQENVARDPQLHDVPDRGALIAGDLAADCERRATTTRIEIDDETGTTKSGALQVVELAAPFGQEVDFEGKLVAFADSANEAQQIETLLLRAIKLVPAIGAFKSAGFGEVVSACVAIEAPAAAVQLPKGGLAEATAGKAPERIAYRVTFDWPILVDADRVTDNLFVGSTIVPGTAFKGALAAKLKLAVAYPEAGEWEKALANLRISHGFPENDEADRNLSGCEHSTA